MGWQDVSSSAATYTILNSDLTSIAVVPTVLTYEDFPGHLNYRASAYPSVTRSVNGNAIITWQDQDWQEQLYYALIGPDGDEITPPTLYQRVGSTLPESQISSNAYGNAPLAGEMVMLPIVYKDYIPMMKYYLPLAKN